MPGSHPREVRCRVAVVGGVYRERCRLPSNSDETWGSGGRAAAVIAGLGLETTLYTAVDKQTEGLLASLAQTFQFETVAANVDVTCRTVPVRSRALIAGHMATDRTG